MVSLGMAAGRFGARTRTATDLRVRRLNWDRFATLWRDPAPDLFTGVRIQFRMQGGGLMQKAFELTRCRFVLLAVLGSRATMNECRALQMWRFVGRPDRSWEERTGPLSYSPSGGVARSSHAQELGCTLGAASAPCDRAVVLPLLPLLLLTTLLLLLAEVE